MEPPTAMAEEIEISQTIYIDQNSNKYPLTLNCIGNMISFSLNYNSSNYTKKISLKEIKDINSIPVFLQYSPQDFSDYLKALSETKQISLVKKDNIISIKFELKIMLRKHEIEIELISKDKNIELVEKDLQKLKKENNELREENK